ncbi:MAG: ABC transporter permease subunit [bacterium]|nr:ABC transporter permease subunit [bacterium]
MTISTIFRNKFIKALVCSLFWIGVWQIVSLIISLDLILPSPLTVLKAWTSLVVQVEFWKSIGASILRTLGGFLIGTAAGSALAFATYRLPLLKTLFLPMLRAIRTVPVTAIILLAFFWFTTDTLPIFIIFLMLLPMVWSEVYTALCQVDIKLLEVAEVYRLSGIKRLQLIIFPSIRNSFLSACTTAIGFAWKAGIATEIQNTPFFSIGKQIQDAKYVLEMPQVFAWTATVVVLSVLFEKAFVLLVRKRGMYKV